MHRRLGFASLSSRASSRASTRRPVASTGKAISQRALAQNLNAIGTHAAEYNGESPRNRQGQDSPALTGKGFPSNRRSWVVRGRAWASNVHSSSEATDFLSSPSRGKVPGSDVGLLRGCRILSETCCSESGHGSDARLMIDGTYVYTVVAPSSYRAEGRR